MILSFNKTEWKERIKKGGLPDVVKINGIVYTMDNYDLEGKELTYGNKKLFAGLSIYTKNRYKTMKDATVEYDEKGYYSIRNDIEYCE